jgi:signal peptidase complex subunit 2
VQYFTEELKYEDDVTVSNIKLIVGVVAVLIALMAQFYSVPFPQSRGFLMGCVVVYWLVNSALQLVHWCVDPDSILITKPKHTAATANTKARTTPPLTIKSELKRYADSPPVR